MKSHELETAVDAVLSSLECLDAEDRWAVLEEALSRSIKATKLVIKRDPDPMQARDYNTLGRMVCWHSRHTLGDEQNPNEDPIEWLKELPPDSKRDRPLAGLPSPLCRR